MYYTSSDLSFLYWDENDSCSDWSCGAGPKGINMYIRTRPAPIVTTFTVTLTITDNCANAIGGSYGDTKMKQFIMVG